MVKNKQNLIENESTFLSVDAHIIAPSHFDQVDVNTGKLARIYYNHDLSILKNHLYIHRIAYAVNEDITEIINDEDIKSRLFDSFRDNIRQTQPAILGLYIKDSKFKENKSFWISKGFLIPPIGIKHLGRIHFCLFD